MSGVTDRQRLAELVEGHDVLVVCGTGGVGKTTVSSALALGAALSGRRALVMTIDPARRLADSLGVTGLLNEPTPIDVAGLLGRELPEGGSLHAMMLNAKATWDDMVHRFSQDEAVRERILSNRYYQRATESLSGSQEYMAMEQLLQTAQSGDYDLIVLDTPPSRNALDFLEAPSRMVSMLADGALRWLRRTEGGRFSSSVAGRAIFGKSRQAMFSIFERFTGSEVIEGIADFVGALSSLLEGMSGRAEAVSVLLRQDSTAFLMVASPNRIALSEALFFYEHLRDAEIPFRGFVINRVRPSSAGPGELPREHEAAFPPREEPEGWNATAAAVWANHRRGARWASVDRHHIDALKSHCGDGLPYVEVPELEGEVHDLDALSGLLEYLG